MLQELPQLHEMDAGPLKDNHTFGIPEEFQHFVHFLQFCPSRNRVHSIGHCLGRGSKRAQIKIIKIWKILSALDQTRICSPLLVTTHGEGQSEPSLLPELAGCGRFELSTSLPAFLHLSPAPPLFCRHHKGFIKELQRHSFRLRQFQ